MERLPLGPVLVIDTPGVDDEGGLGKMRVERTKRVLENTDCAVLIADASRGLNASDRELLQIFKERGMPYVIAMNKCDLTGVPQTASDKEIFVSAKTGENSGALKDRIAAAAKRAESGRRLVGDLLEKGDIAVLVVPIDSAAPKGRLILPQQQAIRDLLESGCIPMVCRESELELTLSACAKKPAMVITDSQAFKLVAEIVPQEIPLTSFSILMARYKGFLETAVKGVTALKDIRGGDKILISEGCTHHRQCGDIGTEKLPRWIRSFTGAQPQFEFSSGGGFPEEPSQYKLVIHCGGCMLNASELTYRMKSAEKAGVPFTNYGTAIAYMNGILKRSLAPFPALEKLV